MQLSSIFGGSSGFEAILVEAADSISDFYPRKYKGESFDLSLNEFEKSIVKWEDPIWLHPFFMHYREDLTSFDRSMSVQDAMNQVEEESYALQNELEKFSKGATEKEIEVLFQPLENTEKDLRRYELQKLKAKGAERKGLIRLYALKYDESYVITGGTIKLTRFLDERPHTKLELYKLDAAKKFLESL
jgi:hypothetical protein